MAYEISRREVLNNLIRFKDSLVEMRGEDRRRQDQGREEERESKHQNRVYKVLLNRKTGDMRFAKKISTLQTHISKKGEGKESAEDWKEVRIVVNQKSPADTAHFEVHDTHNQSLKAAELDPLAWRIASETIDVLNSKAKEVRGKKGLAEEAVLEDLSSIHISGPKERIDDLAGWMGSLSRIDAEQILSNRPIGTYLIREGDEITVSIAFHFSEENLLSIHPYVLTVVEGDDKISDILLLQTNKGWTKYCDDPNLKDGALYEYFSSPQGLLHVLSHIAKYPLA
jgi:hypothetical protein